MNSVLMSFWMEIKWMAANEMLSEKAVFLVQTALLV